MCGIVGIQSQSSVESIRSAIVPMISALKHRGPDYLGIECVSNKEFSLGFAHQRLSILDLSMDGNQPMYAKSKNWLLIFNGEIYNHQEIKKSKVDLLIGNSSHRQSHQNHTEQQHRLLIRQLVSMQLPEFVKYLDLVHHQQHHFLTRK